jgi:hypothetical protein
MLENLREDWRRFKASKSGFRFRDRRRRSPRIDQSGFYLPNAFHVAGGLVIAITSLLLAPLPGPGWGTFFVGLMILAGELLIVARFLDRAEVIIRGPARRARAVWASVPAAARLLIGIIVPVCGAAFGLWVLLSAVR